MVRRVSKVEVGTKRKVGRYVSAVPNVFGIIHIRSYLMCYDVSLFSSCLVARYLRRFSSHQSCRVIDPRWEKSWPFGTFCLI